MDGGNPRVWKWMVPAMLAPCFLVLQLWINLYAERARWPGLEFCGFATVPIMAILAIQAGAGFRAYYREIETMQFVDRRNAMATTAEIRLFEMAKLMHPETVRLLLHHRKMVWRIRETSLHELVDWVLDADPRVHVEFVEYVLKNSTQWSMMPKHGFLSDKAYDFDSQRLTTDYEQYDGLHKVLMNRGMATDALGNQAGLWIEPWNPELVARHFGIVLDEEGDLDDRSENS